MARSPANAVKEETFEGMGGLKIFLRSWKPASKPRGVIVICHGVNSHGGQYISVGEQFAASGFATYALDLRGRGKSEGARFFVNQHQRICQRRFKHHKIGKSPRSRPAGFPARPQRRRCRVLLLCARLSGRITGLICESFAFKVPAPDFALAIIKGLSRIAPNLPVLTLKNKDFTRDPVALQALNSDPLIAKEVQPALTVAALVRADERLKKEFPRITLPVFILHGTADKATVPSGSQFFYDTVGSKDKKLKLYEGHFHDLLNDIGKEKVMADIKDWIEKRL